MGLVKAKKAATAPPPPGGGSENLLERLDDADPAARRYAARALASVDGAGEALCDRLDREADESVRAALLGSLRQHCTPRVVDRLIDSLRSEDAGLRNGVIEVLGDWPEAVAQRVDALLGDADSDVRILTVNVLATLPHPGVPAWLEGVLERDDHVNVCAAAVDALTEVGGEEAIPALQSAARRFADEPFLQFAIDMALRRIGAS